jgi:hypothetical protein
VLKPMASEAVTTNVKPKVAMTSRSGVMFRRLQDGPVFDGVEQ